MRMKYQLNFIFERSNRTCGLFHHVRKITIMAVNEKRLNITEFDFDDVKDNLKVFLKIKQNLKIMTLRVLV